MTKQLSYYQSQITDKYIEFLNDLVQKNAPVFGLFEGAPSKSKKETLNRILKFFSVLNKRLDRAGVECDAYDVLSEMLTGLEYAKRKQMNSDSYNADTLNFIHAANLLITKIANFIYQGYIMENADHSLEVAPLTLPSVDVKNMKMMIAQNLQKMPEAIICADGKVYPARDMHDLLVSFLIANNIDLRGAVRIDAIEIGYNVTGNPRDGRIVFSSLDQFGYMWKELYKDRSVWLSKEQAESMYKFFLAVKQTYPDLRCSFKDVLLASENLGWQAEGNERNRLDYYHNSATKENLELLGDAVAKECDAAGRRRQDLEVLNMCDELIRQNNMHRSVLVNKNPLRVVNPKGPSHTNNI